MRIKVAPGITEYLPPKYEPKDPKIIIIEIVQNT